MHTAVWPLPSMLNPLGQHFLLDPPTSSNNQVAIFRFIFKVVKYREKPNVWFGFSDPRQRERNFIQIKSFRGKAVESCGCTVVNMCHQSSAVDTFSRVSSDVDTSF